MTRLASSALATRLGINQGMFERVSFPLSDMGMD